MAEKADNIHIENLAGGVPRISPRNKLDIPAILMEAKENAHHVRLGRHTCVVMALTAVAICSQIMVSVSAGSVLSFIIRDLGEPAIAGWVIQGPLLMQCIFAPLIGRLSDILDRKYMVSIPPLIAVAGSIVSARATSMSMLIGGGILIGATLPTSAVVHAIQAEILPLKYRAVAGALTFIGGAGGSIIGGLVAGAVTSKDISGWRNIYWMQAGFHGATSLGFLLFYWPIRRSDYPVMSIKRYIWLCDPVGSVIFMTSSALILLALNWSGGTYAWSDAHVVAPLGIGSVFFVLFCLYEWKGRTDGLVPHILFDADWNFPISIFAFAVEGWIWYSAVNQVVPQMLLNMGFEDNSWSISIRQLSYSVTSLGCSMIVSWWATRFKDLKTPVLVTFGVFLISAICYATLSPEQNTVQIVYNVLTGVGQSGPLTLIPALVQFATPHRHLSTANGLAYSWRSIGGSFGSAVLNTIINNYIRKHHAKDVSKAAISAGLPASSAPDLVAALQSKTAKTAVKSVPGINATILAAASNASHWTYARAYRLAWWSIVPFVVLALATLFFLHNVRELMTEKVEATVEHVNEDEEHTHAT